MLHTIHTLCSQFFLTLIYTAFYLTPNFDIPGLLISYLMMETIM